MKKSLLLFGLLAGFASFTKAQVLNIPDANFKEYLVGNSEINTNGDSEIQVSEAVAFTGTIGCNGLNIADLTGIEAFVNITQLNCNYNQLTNLNVSKNIALQVLSCSQNQLANLDVSKNTALTTLSCHWNLLTSLDLSKNMALKILYCYSNQLQNLDISKNIALQIFYCERNKLTSLDVSKNTNLQGLSCHQNQLINLNLKNGNNTELSYMWAENNPNLTCIQVDNPAASVGYSNWLKDATASYNIDCGFVSIRPIITKWNTNANNDNSQQIIIPKIGEFSYTWVKADDTSITGSGTQSTITFPEIGEYIVSIKPTGANFKFFFQSIGSELNSRKLTELSQWGDVSWNTNLSGMFSGCSNLQITATDIPNFSNVTNMSVMFRECSTLTTVPNMNSWNTSNVSSMSGMFENATNFNQDIGNWNTSKVTSMYGMFRAASKFSQNLGNWNLNSDVNLIYMLAHSGMSCENYSKTLYGWAENPATPYNPSLIATGLKYGISAQIYRNKLINEKGWAISEDSFDSSCVVQLAVAENSKKEITIYPNPVKDILHFSEEVSNIKITDISGRTVKEFSAKSKSVNVANLAKGVYLITTIAKSGETVTKKIVKE